MKNSILIFLFLFQKLNSQSLDFHFNYGVDLLLPDKNYYNELINDSFSISTLKFYVSNIKCYQENKMTSWIQNPILVGLNEIKSSLYTFVDSSKCDSLSFDLGIDSVTNVSGNMNGALDPINGMYWTWQSGFINFKFEGKSKVCKTRKNMFQYHIGGYAFPFSAIQTLGFKFDQKSNVNIVLDVKKIIDSCNIISINEIMSPRKEAVEMSKIIAKSFNIE